jgi:uncharacterized membrane protein (UPF0182 family)
MPIAFIKHLSYPKAWFTLQMNLYARFHQTDPVILYQQSEALELASMDEKPVEPYFLTLDLDEFPGEDLQGKPGFGITQMLDKGNRHALSSLNRPGYIRL